MTAGHCAQRAVDIVGKWTELHGQPLALQLTGTAGCTFSQGDGGEHLEMDALDFVRALCGPLPSAGVMRHPLPL